jgi:hypothetical protein
MTTPVPVLGTQGFVDDDVIKFTQLLMNYMVTDHSQSTVFAGQLYSLSKEMQASGNSPPKFMQNLRSSLSTYLGLYYGNTDVSVSEVPITDPAKQDESHVLLSVRIIASNTGMPKDYRYLLKTSQGQFKELIRYNNTGR